MWCLLFAGRRIKDYTHTQTPHGVYIYEYKYIIPPIGHCSHGQSFVTVCVSLYGSVSTKSISTQLTRDKNTMNHMTTTQTPGLFCDNFHRNRLGTLTSKCTTVTAVYSPCILGAPLPIDAILPTLTFNLAVAPTSGLYVYVFNVESKSVISVKQRCDTGPCLFSCRREDAGIPYNPWTAQLSSLKFSVSVLHIGYYFLTIIFDPTSSLRHSLLSSPTKTITHILHVQLWLNCMFNRNSTQTWKRPLAYL